MFVSISVEPNSIHTKSRLLDIQMRYPPEELLMPLIYLYEALLVIGQGQPLVAPATGADGI